jgi:hypothetical protein
MSGTKKAEVVLDTVIVLCPGCGEPLVSGQNNFSWTMDDLWEASQFNGDEVDGTMCAGCGLFVSVPYPKSLKLPDMQAQRSE